MSAALSRRGLLTGLVGLAACVRKPTVQAIARGNVTLPVRLGWRWPPGMQHTFRSVVTRSAGNTSVSRAEEWRYTAYDLDATGTVLIRGRLLGVGVTAMEDGQPVDDATLRAVRDKAIAEANPDVELALRMTGRLVACSAHGFGAALPHQLLALHLPSAPATPGTTWDDPGLAVALAGLVPAELPTQVDARTRLLGLTGKLGDTTSDEAVEAVLEHDVLVRTTDAGPVLRVRGTTTWDTDPGAIGTRKLELRIAPDPAADGHVTGLLRVELSRDRSQANELRFVPPAPAT